MNGFYLLISSIGESSKSIKGFLVDWDLKKLKPEFIITTQNKSSPIKIGIKLTSFLILIKKSLSIQKVIPPEVQAKSIILISVLLITSKYHKSMKIFILWKKCLLKVKKYRKSAVSKINLKYLLLSTLEVSLWIFYTPKTT